MSTEKIKTLEDSLDEMASEIAISAKTAESLTEQISAFRALSTYWMMKNRLNPDGDGEGSALEEIRNGIAEAGGAKRGKSGRAAKNGSASPAGHS